jgi:carbon monoxide dehydrogenase subunit G
MAILRERIDTRLGIDEAFAFVADFANAERWDPGVASSNRIGDGPVGVGARYRLGIRMAGRVLPMEYEITTFEPSRRVVLTGRGSSVDAVDDISFESTPTGTRIHYVADIRLGGLLGLLSPFAGGAFRRIAENARTGMQRTLDELARARSAVAAAG